MNPELKAYIAEQGGKLAGDLLRAFVAKPHRTVAEPEAQRPPQATPSPAAALQSTIRTGLDPERMGWQENLAQEQVFLLEGHLKNNCVGCGGDLSCCWKHSGHLIKVALETLSMTTDPFWQNMKALAEEIRIKSHPDDVKAQKYIADYPTLTVRLSEFRVTLEGNEIARARRK